MTSMAAYLPRASPDVIFPLATLHSAALWYPQVPCPSMNLNEDSFIPRTSYLSGFSPLVLNHFGGQGGKYLSRLTGITIAGVHDISQMVFSYNDEMRLPSFGRTRHMKSRYMIIRDFSIDGPGGEAIVSVDCAYRLGKRTILVYCRFTTNRGRSIAIPDQPSPPVDDIMVRTTHVSSRPGTVITGFYGAQDPGCCYGIIALGVISEMKDEDEF